MGNILRCVKDDDDGTSYRPSLDDTPSFAHRLGFDTNVIESQNQSSQSSQSSRSSQSGRSKFRTVSQNNYD